MIPPHAAVTPVGTMGHSMSPLDRELALFLCGFRELDGCTYRIPRSLGQEGVLYRDPRNRFKWPEWFRFLRTRHFIDSYAVTDLPVVPIPQIAIFLPHQEDAAASALCPPIRDVAGDVTVTTMDWVALPPGAVVSETLPGHAIVVAPYKVESALFLRRLFPSFETSSGAPDPAAVNGYRLSVMSLLMRSHGFAFDEAHDAAMRFLGEIASYAPLHRRYLAAILDSLRTAPSVAPSAPSAVVIIGGDDCAFTVRPGGSCSPIGGLDDRVHPPEQRFRSPAAGQMSNPSPPLGYASFAFGSPGQYLPLSGDGYANRIPISPDLRAYALHASWTDLTYLPDETTLINGVLLSFSDMGN